MQVMGAAVPRKVIVVMGVFQPNIDLLRKQLASIIGQKFSDIDVLLFADGPVPAGVTDLLNQLADERISLIEFADTQGVHRNFARGLREAVARSAKASDLFAFCDQDDEWMPNKLAEQVQCLEENPDAMLCHCDAQLVSVSGKVIALSMFAFEHRSKRMGLRDLVVKNSVTGMTCLFRKSVAEAALEFPMSDTPKILHDHWVALVACLQGQVIFQDKPLVHYVLHGKNVLGAASRATTLPFANLLFGGKAYFEKCRNQYVWRSKALIALKKLNEENGNGTAKLNHANFLGMRGYRVLASHCISRLFSGEIRQSSQAWRLLIGKLLTD